MQLRHRFLFPFILIPAFLSAQDKTDTAVMAKIRAEAMTRSQVSALSRELMDEGGPRLTNSPGYDSAVKWAVAKLSAWGLSAAPEPWGEFGNGWKNEKISLAMSKPYYQPLIAYPVAWTNGTDGPQTAQVALIESLDSAVIDAQAAALKGKIVMVRQKPDTIVGAFKAFSTRFKGSELDTLPEGHMLNREVLEGFLKTIYKQLAGEQYLQTKGVIAVLSAKKMFRDGTVAVQGTPGFSKTIPHPMPEIALSLENYLRLQRLIDDKKPVEVALDVKNEWYPENKTGYNVIAEIKGSDPKLKEEVVMLGGHLDSWHAGTGATDNGAGCVVMMEAVRIIRALGLSPRRTIRIALWGGEEQGLLGSFGYVKKHFGDPQNMKLKPEQKKISVYFNLDNGSGKIRGVFLQHNDSARAIFRSWLQPFAGDSATGLTIANTGSTDHLSFDAVGIPGFQFIQDPLEYETRTHHSNMDVYDHLSIEDMKQASMIVAAFIYNAAMRPAMFPRKPVPKAERFVFDTDEPL